MRRKIRESMRIITFAALFFGILGWPRLGAQTPSQRDGFPGLDADPWALEYARLGASRPYSWQELAEIALWASGDATDRLMDRILGAAAELEASPSFPPDPRGQGEFILEFIHKKLLKNYSERQTRVDEIFVSGRYNCVSSAALYLILAASQGIEAWGVITRDHAFVTVRVGKETIDVETTNPYGFDPGSRREFHDGFGRLTGFAYVPARNYRDRADISPLELISLVFANRIFDLESQGRYGDSVPLALNRAVLLSRRSNPVSSPFFADPRQDLIDRLLNFGVSLVKAGKEEDALRWAALAGAKYPHERWEEFTYGAMNNLLVKFIRSQRFTEARTALNARASALSRDDLSRLDTLLTDAELAHQSSRIRTLRDAEASLGAIGDAETSRVLSRSRAEEMRTFVLLKMGEILAAEQGWRKALVFLEDAVKQYGRNSQLDNALRVFRSNRVTEIHNRFADLFNGRKYDDALRVVREGIAELPGNRQLQSDLTQVERALRSR
jgi:tetratricopeptide (TPR) repeat protein